MTLYMKTTTDQYELPLIVEDSPTKLAIKLGLNAHSVATMCSKRQSGYLRIYLPEPETYPDNDGGLWYYDKDGRVVTVEEYE